MLHCYYFSLVVITHVITPVFGDRLRAFFSSSSNTSNTPTGSKSRSLNGLAPSLREVAATEKTEASTSDASKIQHEPGDKQLNVIESYEKNIDK